MDEREELQGSEYERKVCVSSGDSKKTIHCVTSLMWNLKFVTTEPIKETETVSQT